MTTFPSEVELSIKFDHPEEMFFSGETVTGHVTSKVNTWLKVSVLKAVLVGKYNLLKKTGDRFIHTIVEETAKLSMDGRLNDIPVGTYVSAFDFKLGSTFPSSVATVAGSVVYKVVARCGYKVSETSDIRTLEAVSYISVSKKVDLQDYPFAMVPVRTCRRISPDGICSFLLFKCCGDELQVKLETPRRAYVCGEKVVVSATIINRTSHVLTESKIELLQVLICSSAKRKVSVVRSSRGMISKYANRVWLDESITVPALPPSSDDPTLQISYQIRIFLTRDDDKQVRVKVPILIGNVPSNDELIEGISKEISFSYRGGGDADHEFVPSYIVYRFAESAPAAPSAPELCDEAPGMVDVPLELESQV